MAAGLPLKLALAGKYMKRLLNLLLVVGSVALGSCETMPPSETSSAQCPSSIVRVIYRARVSGENGSETERSGNGSGVLLSTSESLVATAYHVVDGALSIQIDVGTSEHYSAVIATYDKKKDLALLKPINLKEGVIAQQLISSHRLTEVVFAQAISEKSAGLVCGYAANKTSLSPRMLSYQKEPLSQAMQMTSPSFFINIEGQLFPGESGGGFFDPQGHFLGTLDSILKNDGGSAGFAIPSDALNQLRHSNAS